MISYESKIISTISIDMKQKIYRQILYTNLYIVQVKNISYLLC